MSKMYDPSLTTIQIQACSVKVERQTSISEFIPFFDHFFTKFVFDFRTIEIIDNKKEITGCSNSICAKKTPLLPIKNALLSHKNDICTFMRCGHLTYDPWIWLKVTSMASTASNRKSAKTPYNSGFLIIHVTLRDQYW